jgi:hypothetical protein
MAGHDHPGDQEVVPFAGELLQGLGDLRRQSFIVEMSDGTLKTCPTLVTPTRLVVLPC